MPNILPSFIFVCLVWAVLRGIGPPASLTLCLPTHNTTKDNITTFHYLLSNGSCLFIPRINATFLYEMVGPGGDGGSCPDTVMDAHVCIGNGGDAGSFMGGFIDRRRINASYTATVEREYVALGSLAVRRGSHGLGLTCYGMCIVSSIRHDDEEDAVDDYSYIVRGAHGSVGHNYDVSESIDKRTTHVFPGDGGHSRWGMGGVYVPSDPTQQNGADGMPGVGYGAGGSGAWTKGTARKGGKGAPGLLLIEEYVVIL